MKKRNVLTLMLIAILALALGLGTMAKYRKTFSSGENLVRAAKFEVDSNGTLDENVEFNLSEDPIYPGYENENVYEFEIDKKGTEVQVKYNIAVIANGELFGAVEKGNSPVVMALYRETENGWAPVANELEINPVKKDVEKFRIGLKWNDSDYDIEYQNKSGNIAINVVATQVGGVTPPEEPEEPTIVSLVDPAPITVTVGDSVTMPSTVVANMSDGTTKDVPVTWEPATIDTTTAGTKTATGTVEGYNGNVTFMVTVEEAENLDPYIEKVIHGLSWQGHHQYNIENYKNLPGTHYQLIAHLKNGNIIEMSSQVKLHQGVLYNLCSPEEIDYFDVQIGNKPVSYMPWEYIMTIENVPFEYSN